MTRKRPAAFALALTLVMGVMVVYPRLPLETAAAAETPSGNGDTNGSASIDIADAVHFLTYLFASGPAPEPIACGGVILPSTGQDECYDSDGNVIDCASPAFPGQDGFYRAGCPKEGRYIDSGDGTVTDTCTGLEWQVDTADVNGGGTITIDDRVVSWQAALTYCENLRFAGHDDWRLPNIRELQSLVDYGRCDPAIDPIFGALSDAYCSSTAFRPTLTGSPEPDIAWRVYFGTGSLSKFEISSRFPLYLRAVRGGP